MVWEMEASDSGLFHHLGKVAGSKGSREFKSHRLRQGWTNSPALLFLAMALIQVFAMSDIVPERFLKTAMQIGSTCWIASCAVLLVLWIKAGKKMVVVFTLASAAGH